MTIRSRFAPLLAETVIAKRQAPKGEFRSCLDASLNSARPPFLYAAAIPRSDQNIAMKDARYPPSLLRRAVGSTALYLVGIPIIVLGMLLVFSIVAYDTVERRFRAPPTQDPL